MPTISIMTYNLKDYGADPAVHGARYRLVEQVIREASPDILLVQELMTPPPAHGYWMSADQKWRHRAARAPELVADLADRTGLAVPQVDGRPAVGIGGGDRHTAILYRPGTVTVEDGSFRAYGPQQQVWHSIVAAVVQVPSRRGVQRMVVGSAHLNPFSIDQQLLDTTQVHRAVHLNFTDPDPDLPGFIGGDWNSTAASVRPDGDPYDPDPYEGMDWRPIFAIQLGPDGRVDRRTAQRLENQYRLRDLAVLAGADWCATTGHDPADQHPARRLDRLYATPSVPADAVEDLTVITSPAARKASDHLPALGRINTDRLSQPSV